MQIKRRRLALSRGVTAFILIMASTFSGSAPVPSAVMICVTNLISAFLNRSIVGFNLTDLLQSLFPSKQYDFQRLHHVLLLPPCICLLCQCRNEDIISNYNNTIQTFPSAQQSILELFWALLTPNGRRVYLYLPYNVCMIGGSFVKRYLEETIFDINEVETLKIRLIEFL